MANNSRWYFYNGRKTAPVRLADGRTFAVRPRGHVFTTPAAARALGPKLRPCAPPPDAAKILSSLDIAPPAPPSADELKAAPGALSKVVKELTPKPSAEKSDKPEPKKRSRKASNPDETRPDSE